MCRNKVLLVFKNVQNLFFTPRFLLSFFRLMSLVSHHREFLEKMFYKKNLPFFLFSVVNYSQLCSFRLMHTQFRSILHDLKSFDYVKKQFYCLHRIVVGLKFKLPTRQNKEKEKWPFFWFSQVKFSKLCAETKFYWFSKVYRTCFLHQNFFSLSLDWCL